MPSSLRLLIIFMVTSIAVAAGSIVVLKEQDRAQARMVAEQLTGGSVTTGKLAFQTDGCGACHAVEAVAGADGQVGPPLDTIGTRAELAGHLANTPGAMRRWIQHPQRVAPGNGMPEMNISDTQARDISAYLYTLRAEQ
jgi:cytochrome c2